MYVDGPWFKDDKGRTLLLRGINLGGSSKLPTHPNGATHLHDGFYDHRHVSFVGRPFPLEEADEHFARLRHWGMTFVRFLVTWEAIEHAGPGIYDEDYLDYLHAVLEKAHEHGIQVFIDPHQDVWSRWTGGDGAPGWTLEAVGIELENIHKVGAAVTQQTSEDYRRMIWLTNFFKFGASTMFTLFFAGDDFAPETKIDGTNTREYLQTHYINAIRRVAERLQDLPNIAGYDTMNEPVRGYIGLEDLTLDEPQGILSLGPTPTPLEAMRLAAGHTVRVRDYRILPWGTQPTRLVTLNPEGVRLWRDDAPDIWQQNDVWTDDGGEARVLKPYHFSRAHGQQVDFVEDYLRPFFHRYTDAVRSVKRHYTIFIQGVPNIAHPTWKADDPDNVAYAGHWYDNATLFLKSFYGVFNFEATRRNFRPVVGRGNVQAMFNDQLARLQQTTRDHMNNIPVLLGEFGLPMDLNGGEAYRTGDFSTHITALDMYYNALDANLLNATLWNYTPDNTNAYGDGWNGEDLSIFSRDQQTNPDDINSGGRALPAVVRPYPLATAGDPLAVSFNLQTRTFEYRWRPDLSLSSPTIIFVPKLQYPTSYTVEGDVGLTFEANTPEQRLYIWLDEDFQGDAVSIRIWEEN